MRPKHSSFPEFPIQPWERLWAPVDKWELQPRVDEDFLTGSGAPNASGFGSFEPLNGIGALKAFSDVPFLLLLGRPGAGKSQEMQEAYEKNWLGQPSILIQGKEIGKENPGPVIESAIDAEALGQDAGLRILIDGLDEALLQNLNFVPQLVKWMRGQKASCVRMAHRLAISCRWADWPEAQVQSLAALWNENDFKKLVLCPLRGPDVTDTLRKRYGDTLAERFWRLLNDRHLQSVGCWPQGFKTLMAGFEENDCQDLPHSLGAAMADQIRRHCRLAETRDDQLRWEVSIHGTEWRERVAGRLAAVMFWSGKSSLRLDSTTADVRSLTCDDLIHTDEFWEDGLKTIRESDLDELVKRTGLLKRLSGTLSWVFQSQVYQEWLAAHWLHAQSLDGARLRILFGIADSGGWKVFPKLRAVAAWLARMSEAFRKVLLKEDPLTLLMLDAASLPDQDRRDVVDAILKATHEARVLDSSVYQAHLHSLVHDDLGMQLRRWLLDDMAHTAAKQMAVEMVEKTGLRSLVPLLWEIYPHTADALQNSIAYALHSLADDDIYAPQWKDVLIKRIPIDENATMIGAALEILVIKQQCVAVRDVLDWFVPEIDFGVIGLYSATVATLHEKVTLADLPALLSRLSANPRDIHAFDSPETTRRLNFRALRLAFQNINLPEVASALADYWHACVRQHVNPHHDWNSGWTPESIGLESDAQRRAVIDVLIHHPGYEEETQRKSVWGSQFLFIESDVEWCLDKILDASPPDDGWRYALPCHHYQKKLRLDGPLAEKLMHAWHKSEFLRQLLPTPQEGETIIETLNREVVIREQDRDRASQQIQDHRIKCDAAFKQNLEQLTTECREKHAKGEIVWPVILRVLHMRLHGEKIYLQGLGAEAQICDNEAWIRDAAFRYLIERPVQFESERSNGSTALFALVVLPEPWQTNNVIRSAVEEHWLPSLLLALGESNFEKKSVGLSLETLAAFFPEAFVRAFGQNVSRLYVKGTGLGILNGYQGFWSPKMTDALAGVLKTGPIQPEGFLSGLRFLGQVSETSAVDVVERWLKHFASIEDERAQAVLIGAATLFLNGRLSSQIETCLADPIFAAKALGTALHSLGYHEMRMDVTGWPDHALLSLANLLWCLFTDVETWPNGPRGLTHGDLNMPERFRDHITNQCRSRGLPVTIPRTHPDDTPEEAKQREWIAHKNFHETRKAQADAGWQTISPPEFLKLAQKPSARLARSNDELMEAVMACLKRWEESLDHGAWDHLWDLSGARPRDEKRIAKEMRDWLKRELNVVTECEVELMTEARTDILIQTMPKSTAQGLLTVVIELKKWRVGNSGERRTHMQTQLLDRYLTQRQHEGWTHGLYVIAWTTPPNSKSDTVESIQRASRELDLQALELSHPPYTLKSMVIDARFRGKIAAKPRKKAPGKKTKGKSPKE